MRALKSILDTVGNYRVFLNVMMKGNVSAMSANPNPTILKGTWCNSFVLLSQCQIWKGYKQHEPIRSATQYTLTLYIKENSFSKRVH